GQVVCLIDTDAPKPGGGENDSKEVAKEEKEATSAKEEELESSDKNKEKAEAKTEAPSKSTTPSQKQDTYATGTPSPAAKKILDEKGMDANSLEGSGRDGRITKEDAVNARPSMGTPGKGKRGEERKKMSMLRRKVAERLVSVKNDTAMLTTFNEVDMSAIFSLRKQ
ncbi:E3 binding domain-containing protein, partial [Salinimicrobium oceani]